jgi:uncharacterized protein YcfL
MLASVVLTGCSSKTDVDDIIEEAAKNTVTLSMYLMSEAEVSAEQEAKIEEAVNLITKSKFKIQVDLRYYTPDKYYDELVEVSMPRRLTIKLKAILSKNPKADIEEVVRCEKCVDYLYDTPYCKKNNIGYCDRDGAIKQKNHFCSYGERKENND